MLPTGQGGGASHQRGNAFPRAERGWPVFPRAKARLLGFIIRGRLLSIHRRPPQPSAAKPLSHLRTLGAIAPSNFRTLKPHRGLSIRRLYGFRCPRQRHIKLPSEPARSVGRTHRSVRSTRTIEPGRREAPESSSPSGLVHKACQPTGIPESTAPAPIPTATQEACQTKRPGRGAGSFCYLNQLPEGMAAVMIDFLRIPC